MTTTTKLTMSYDTAQEMKCVSQVKINRDGSTQPLWEPRRAGGIAQNDPTSIHYSIASHTFGVAKSRSANRFGQIGLGVGDRSAVSREEEARAPGTAYGQDRVGVEDIWGTKGEVAAKLLWVNDGHGSLGEKSAAGVADQLCMQYSMPGQLDKIQSALKNSDGALVQQIVEEMYKTTAAYIQKKLGGNEGGTTCSHALLVTVDDQSYVITSNMGDSPVVIVDPKTGTVLETHGVHNWDNLEEYQLYDQRCRALGVPTAQAVYNRFNCGNGSLPGPNGDCKPVPIFRRNTDSQQMEVDPENLAYITSVMAGWGAVGGFQSEARMVMEDKETGEVKEPLAGFGHTNWGSVVLLEEVDRCGVKVLEGGAQCSRSFADWAEQRTAHTIGDTPTVNVTAVEKDAVVLVMSDGAADVIGYMHQFGKKVKELCEVQQDKLVGTDVVGTDASAIVQGLGEWIMQRGTSTANYGLRDGKPTWDDVTIAGATFVGHAVQESAGNSDSMEVENVGSMFDEKADMAETRHEHCSSTTFSHSPSLGSCRFLMHSSSSASSISDMHRAMTPRVSF